MSSQKWLIDISMVGPDDQWRDITSAIWEKGARITTQGETLPAEVQEAFERFEPAAHESGFWDVQVGKVLYRITYREA